MSTNSATTPVKALRQPVLFVPHGGGPWPFVDLGQLVSAEDARSLRLFLEQLPQTLPEPPRAVLVISAHWEERVPTVMTSARPPMLYDYYGFPDAAYSIEWPAPGSPELAERVVSLLQGAGIAAARDATRGFDHGTFVPFKLAWPQADVPTIQLSLQVGLDPTQHLEIGRALAPLRDEGVFIVGSGMSYHNMRGFFSGKAHAVSVQFDDWLKRAITAAPAARDEMLATWTTAPGARDVHPREEHLLPLMVIAGAAGSDLGQIPWNKDWMRVRVSAARFG